MPNFIINNAKLEDMDFLLSLAKEEGWNPGLQDAIPFYHTDPNGFFIGEISGKKIGCISAVSYSEDFGFMGFYIVLPEYRGKGFGLQLWDRAVKYLGARSIGLDGVVAQQENYKKSHFQLYYRNIRFEGKGSGRASNSLTDLKEIAFETLLKYDAPIFGLSRKSFLEHWILMPNAISLGKLHQGLLRGYGTIRLCHNGYKIGPLFADDLETASEIYQGLLAKAEMSPVFLDVPEINQQALQLVENANLVKVFETARMYNKPPPKQQTNKIFGVTSFELG